MGFFLIAIVLIILGASTVPVFDDLSITVLIIGIFALIILGVSALITRTDNADYNEYMLVSKQVEIVDYSKMSLDEKIILYNKVKYVNSTINKNKNKINSFWVGCFQQKRIAELETIDIEIIPLK